MTNKSFTHAKFFTVFVKKLASTIICLSLLFICKSQSIIDEAFIPIIDSNEIVVAYIKKTSIKEYNHPKPVSKIMAYDEKLNLVGYWMGKKKKFIKVKS